MYSEVTWVLVSLGTPQMILKPGYLPDYPFVSYDYDWRSDSAVPISQAVYRKNGSTSEHVLATNLIIERTISSKDETVYLLLLDMSKAFHSIQRNTLIEDLKNLLNKDKLHLIQILLDVKITVKCGDWKKP